MDNWELWINMKKMLFNLLTADIYSMRKDCKETRGEQILYLRLFSPLDC